MPVPPLRTSSPFRRATAAAVLCATVVQQVLCGPVAMAAEPIALPELGNASAAIVSPAEERNLGDQIIRAVRRGLPTTPDPALKYFTSHLLAELAAASELENRDLNVVVVESGALNAFAAPGNVIAVNMGLFVHAQNVHELSAVLAHEIAHLSQRHFARGVEFQRKATLPYLAAMLASIALMATVGGDAGLAALSTTQAASQDSGLRFSRGREQEADRVGIETLHRAGLDPHAMSAMFERLAAAYRYQQRPPEFLLTHPVTESRIADARNQASGLPRTAHLDRNDYQFARCRARVTLAPSADVAVATMSEQRRAQPTAPASDYCLALALSRAHEHADALAHAAELKARLPDDLYVSLLQIELLIEAGEHARAAQLAEAGLRVNPDNTPYALYHAKALAQGRRHADAVKVLQRQVQLHPEDADIWYELAEAAGLAGEIRTLHLARAEYFQLVGRYDDALKQLSYAQRIGAEDPRLQARITQRTEDIERMKERLEP
jgi:predicted Zn-dependent protease